MKKPQLQEPLRVSGVGFCGLLSVPFALVLLVMLVRSLSDNGFSFSSELCNQKRKKGKLKIKYNRCCLTRFTLVLNIVVGDT